MSNIIDREQVRAFINKLSKDKIFSVKFIKKTNGETRTMNCRKGVTKDVINAADKRGSWNRKQNDVDNNVMTVFDMNKHEFRRINLDSIFELHMYGFKFEVR